MIQDPDNPSQSVGPDGGLTIRLDEHTAPVTTALHKSAQAELAAAKTPEEWSIAVGTALNAAFQAIAWFEYNQNLASPEGKVGDRDV